MEETNKKNKRKILIVFIVLVLVGVISGTLWWTLVGSKPQGPDLVEPEKEAISQDEFEQMPVGLIYEFSEEEQQEFLELAKQNYEEYGDKATDLSENYDLTGDENFNYDIRWGITRKNNTNPTEMLNEDGSLRYPDGFYGFVVSDRSYNDKVYELIPEGNEEYPNADITAKVNMFLNVENYYLIQNNGVGGAYSENGHALSVFYGTDWNNYLYDYLTSNDDNEDNTALGMLINDTTRNLLKRAVDSKFLDAENMNTNKIFELMYAPQIYPDPYELADEFRIGEHQIYKLVDTLETIPSAYNIIDEIPDENVSYYFPTKVWKIDNNTIVVDVQVENGEMLGLYEIEEINRKMSQANTTVTVDSNDEIPEIKDDTYVVYARLFNSDITQGVMPDYGVDIVNYIQCSDKAEYISSMLGYTYVYNETAENILRYYYSQVKTLMGAGNPISSQDILEKAANEYGISYHDAVNIWGAYYISHVYESGLYSRLMTSVY